MRILIVEDKEDLAEAVKRALEEEGYACDAAADGEEGLFNALNWPYDAIVLDLMLPGLPGLELLARLRGAGIKTPVLILTARDTLGEKVHGLDAGADDYLTKPFFLAELLARVRALVRRGAGSPGPRISIGEVEVDTAAHTVRREGRDISLTPMEYAVLELLALHRGRLVSRAMIYDHVYDANDPTLSNVVDVYVANLRRKLGRDLIRTRRGEGYLIP